MSSHPVRTTAIGALVGAGLVTLPIGVGVFFLGMAYAAWLHGNNVDKR